MLLSPNSLKPWTRSLIEFSPSQSKEFRQLQDWLSALHSTGYSYYMSYSLNFSKGLYRGLYVALIFCGGGGYLEGY